MDPPGTPLCFHRAVYRITVADKCVKRESVWCKYRYPLYMPVGMPCTGDYTTKPAAKKYSAAGFSIFLQLILHKHALLTEFFGQQRVNHRPVFAPVSGTHFGQHLVNSGVELGPVF